MTPYTWRNFVTGASTAREGQMGRFFLQKRHFIHKLSVKKQETGQKTGKNPPKKGVFISPSDQLLLQCNESCQLLLQCNESCQLSLHCHKSCSTMSATKVANFCCTATKVARFLSCFLLFHGQFVYEMPFLEKKY